MSESELKPTTRQVILTGDFEKAFQQLNPADQTLLGQYTGMFGFDQLEIEEIAANLNTTSAQVK